MKIPNCPICSESIMQQDRRIVWEAFTYHFHDVDNGMRIYYYRWKHSGEIKTIAAFHPGNKWGEWVDGLITPERYRKLMVLF